MSPDNCGGYRIRACVANQRSAAESVSHCVPSHKEMYTVAGHSAEGVINIFTGCENAIQHHAGFPVTDVKPAGLSALRQITVRRASLLSAVASCVLQLALTIATAISTSR
jgi:hypothetical protein